MPGGSSKRAALALGVCAVAAVAPASAASNITTGTTALASNLGGSVNPDFAGGTLKLDSSTTIARDFTVEDISTNTIDIFGNTVTMSGKFTGAGPLTITDSVGHGILTWSNGGNTYTGATTITSGAVLTLSDAGTIVDSSSLTDNGTFDISTTTSGASVISLGGSGTVALGTRTLTLSAAAGTFGGTITGTGGFTVNGGTEVLTGVSTYTGITSISSGTLTLAGSGSIAASSSVTDNGTFDISATPGVSIKSLSGGGILQLGSQTLTLTAAAGNFYGTIQGSGGLILNGGTEYIYGINTYTGSVTVNAGTLQAGATTMAYNVLNNATFSFYGTSTMNMSGVISGPGAVAVNGGGIAEILTPQTYTGPTTISNGRLALSGSGSIAASSSVDVEGIFDVTATPGASIVSLAGAGSVYLGTATLTLTNAAGSFAGTISGSGGLTLAGGTEAFTGISTYSGPTVIASGTLALPAGSKLTMSGVVDNGVLDLSPASNSLTAASAFVLSLGGSGTVTLGTSTLVLTGAADTFAGTISGSGGLTISGGTETLSGANTYTGATTIAAGSLVLSATGSIAAAGSIADNGTFDVSAAPGTFLSFVSLSGSGTVKAGAHTFVLTNASGTFSGAIQGTGGFVLSGGTEILSGANSYTGGTTISAGTLQISDVNSGGSIVGNVIDNGTLAFGGWNASVFAGTISGSGGVAQTGRGTTILTAANTYAGGTTIASGTLQIGNGGTTGSIAGNVADGGTLAFGRSDGIVFGGTISGTGGVSVVSGTVTLSAAESYTGGTTIASGTGLALSGAGSIAASGGIADNGTFDVSGAAPALQITSLSGSGAVRLGSNSVTLTGAAGTFSGAISGTGGVTIGGGAEAFSGTNGYTGPTVVNGGSLAVNGSIAGSSHVTVNSGGMLAGTGTVPAITVAGGGTLSPGAAGTGTLTANGAVAFANGSSFLVNVSSASNTKLAATGSAALAGTLSVASTNGTYPLGQKLTVLTANGGIAGSFALTPITGTRAQFSSALTYDADNVYLEIDLARLSPLLPTGATRNQKSVVNAIDAAIAAGGKPPTDIESLGNLSPADLATDATQMAGEIGSDVPQAGRSLLTPFMDAIFDHIADDRPAGPAWSGAPASQAGAWASGFDGTSGVAGDAAATGSHKFRSNVKGAVGGANWQLSPSVMLGAAVSAGFADFRLADNNGTGKATALQGGLYGYVRYSPHFYGSFAAAVALDSITTHRVLTVSGTDNLTGKVTAIMLGGRYETGIILGWLTPYLAFRDEISLVPAYGETAASGSSGFALRYASRTINSGGTEIGFRQSVDIDFTPRWTVTPDGTLHLTDRLAWAHEFFSDSSAEAAFAALPAAGFAIRHAMPAKDSALASFGAELKFAGGFSVNLHLDGAVSSNAQSYTGMAGLGYTW